MSQLATATTVARRQPARKGSTASAPRRELRVVTAADAAGSPWFPVLVVGLLLAGLAGVLALNTAMAQDSFEVSRLEARSAQLTDTQDQLTHEVNSQSSPQHLAKRATSLGMVPVDSAAFVDLREGTVLGVAKAAKKPQGFSVDAASRATGSSPSSTPTANPKPTTPEPKAKAKAKTKTASTKTTSNRN